MLGYPWASSFNGEWYPMWWLLHLIPGSFNAYMLLAYVLAAFGTFGLVSAATGSRIAGIVSGLVYALGGFMIGHLGHYDVVQNAGWAPFILWSLVEIRARNGVRWTIAGAVSVAMCAVAGQPQVLAYIFLVAVAFVVVMMAPYRANLAPIRDASVALGLGLAAAAVALLPAAELARASVRAQLPFADFVAFSLPPMQLALRLFFPYALGTTTSRVYPFSSVDGGSFTELANGAGVTAIALAAIALLVYAKRRDVWLWAGVAIVGLVLSTGDGAGLGHVLFHVPVINLFRAQGRHALEVTLALAVLAGYGTAALTKGEATPRHVATALIAVGAIMLATTLTAPAVLTASLGPAIASVIPADPFHNPALGLPIVVAFVAAIVIMWVSLHPRALTARVALVALVIVDLTTFAWFAYWRFTPIDAASLAPPPSVAVVAPELARTFTRLLSLTPDTVMRPNISLLWNVPAADGYVSLLLARPAEMMLMVPQGVVQPAIYLNHADPALDLAAVEYVTFAPTFAQAPAFAAMTTRWQRVAVPGTDLVYRHLGAHPRAWLVHDVEPVSDAQAHAAIRGGITNFATTALVEGADAPGGRSVQKPGPESAIVTALSDDGMTVDVTCTCACYLVTSDAYYEGWHAHVDAAPATVYRTDYALRGVAVPAGRHVVTFGYRPWTLVAGSVISILALSALVAIGGIARARGRW